MALAVSIRFDFVDGKGKPSFTKVRVPTGFTIVAYQEFGLAIANEIHSLTDCRMTNAGICIGIDLSAASLKATANVLADVSQKAWFNFNTILGGFRAKMSIPTLDESKVIAGSGDINQADIDVAAAIVAIEAGIAVTAGTINITDGRGNDINDLASASKMFRRR